ncbi:hypothetical protein DH2020_029162 [Rehmannia glutinosa]|uniref:Retrotransposon Copia-like N-terminal domain-containing protein n=1 Tax=Rehmannia glutinosa TaxID=99300 RepID=A0ABR0VPD2_REHGL
MAEKQKSASSHEDPYNPLFLHHSDHPGVVLVSQLLTEENYNTWSRSMIMALSAKNKISFIDGTISKPASTDSDFQHWIRCNDMVKSWLLNSLSKDIAHSVIYCDLAHDIWIDLKERFAQVNGPRLYQIESEIHNLVQDTMSIATYFTKLKGLWDELSAVCPTSNCSCGAAKDIQQYQQKQRTIKFLMGLNESYSAIRGQILLIDLLPVVSRAYSLVLQEERQRSAYSNKISGSKAAAFATKKNLNTQNGQEQKNMKNKREHPKCEHCGWVGHTIERCYHIHGFPSDYRGRKPKIKNVNHVSLEGKEKIDSLPSTQEQCQQLLSLLKNDVKSKAMANYVGNTSTMTGPTFEDDDWEGN